jgi:hypothetical protein
MKAQSRVLSESEPDASRRVNRSELALWIIGIVLLAASVVLVVGFVKVIIAQETEVTTASTVDHFGVEVAFEQAANVYTPGVVTGGIVCIALAIFLRGLDLNARRRAADVVSASPSEAPIPPLTEPAATPTPVSAPAVQGPPLTDYSAFMRPPDSSTDPTR